MIEYDKRKKQERIQKNIEVNKTKEKVRAKELHDRLEKRQAASKLVILQNSLSRVNSQRDGVGDN